MHSKLRPLISCSSGSACTNGEPSHVLRAIGRSKSEAEASLRLSIGRDTTAEEISKAVKMITSVVLELQGHVI